jgi:general secretion pathway protein C
VGDAELTRVEMRRVEFRREGRLEYLDLFGEGGESKRPAPRKSSKKRRRRRKHADKYDKGIKKIGKHKYEIERKLVNEFLSNAAMAGRGAKIIPNMKNGKSNGFRLYAIRPYSIFSKLGIRNGDVIHAINNQDITSPDKALELYTKLRGASHLTVSITRRNKPVTLHYTIR